MTYHVVKQGTRAQEDRKRIHDEFVRAVAKFPMALDLLLEFCEKYGYFCIKVKTDPEDPKKFILLSNGA